MDDLKTKIKSGSEETLTFNDAIIGYETNKNRCKYSRIY